MISLPRFRASPTRPGLFVEVNSVSELSLLGQTDVRSTAYRWAREARKEGKEAAVVPIEDGFFQVLVSYKPDDLEGIHRLAESV